MDTKQLHDALAKLFVDARERIVFWHDPAHEFIDFMNCLPFLTFDHTTVQIIRLDEVGGLETKMRLERDDPEGRFLLYSPTEEPDYDDDWLLDIRLYSRSFRADRASIILDELGLENHHLREHLAERRTFCDNKDRLQKLKALVASNDTADDLDRKMLSIVVKAEQPELFTIIRTLFHAFTEVEPEDEIDLGNFPPCWDQIKKFDLAGPFWRFVKNTFGYSEDSPSLRNLLIRLLMTDYAHHLQGDVPPSLEHLILPKTGRSNAVVCLAQWRDSSSKGSSYDLLSAEVARIVKIAEYVHPLEIEPFIDVMTFLDVEEAIMRGLRDRVIGTADTITVEEIRAIATRRQHGHWASLTVSASPTIPRRALHAVYDALVAAADFFDLRNRQQDGFDFDTAPAMYRAYETKLFKFDQLYRRFCEAADVAESQNWDVLKKLRERVEAVYVNWYVTNQALAWGKFIDPSGNSGLLKHWRIDQVPNQREFYQQHIRRRLRVCLIRCYSSQTANHHMDHAHLDNSLTRVRQPFVIFAQAPVAIEPPEGPLAHPALGNDHDPLDGVGALGNLQADRPGPPEIPDPVDEGSGIGPSSPARPQPRKLVPQDRQDTFRPVAVLHLGSGDDDGQEPAEGIDQDMPPAPLEVLVRIIAAAPPVSVVLID
jgi:uncharacterized protein (TIGR02687 family)